MPSKINPQRPRSTRGFKTTEENKSAAPLATAAEKNDRSLHNRNDLRHLTRVKSVLSKRFGIGRAGWMQSERVAAKRPGISPRDRLLLAVAIAVAGRLRVPEPVAFRHVADAAAETLPGTGEAA
jgi:hypothetical protein